MKNNLAKEGNNKIPAEERVPFVNYWYQLRAKAKEIVWLKNNFRCLTVHEATDPEQMEGNGRLNPIRLRCNR